MKFDMNQAWNEAVKMIRANREVMAIVAGLFFFVPAVITALVLPEMQQPPAGSEADPEAMMEVMMAGYAEDWWIILLAAFVQMIGTLSLLALLRDTSRPTVGDAIRIGGVGFFPYFLAYLLMVVGLTLVALLLIGGLAAISAALAMVGGLLFLVVLAYALVKFSMIGPVVAIDKVLNPLAVLARSWRLTKGTSLRLFFFYLLLLVAYVVIAMLLSGLFGLIGAALGTGSVALAVQAILSGLLSAAATTIAVGILAAVHRQLSGASPRRIGETFE